MSCQFYPLSKKFNDEDSGHSYRNSFQKLRLPLLDHIVFRTFLYVKHFGTDFKFPSLPSLLPFLGSIPSISSQPPVRLTLHFRFRVFVGNISIRGLVWSDVAALLVLPLFRHPIELHVSREDPRTPLSGLLAGLVSSLKRHSDMEKLLREGKLVVLGDEVKFFFKAQ